MISGAFSLVREQQTSRQSFVLDIEFSIPFSGVTAIFGHSGSGKTTLLRLIAGLEKCTQGQLVVDRQVWQQASTFLPTHKRAIGYVFQEPSLFEHLTATQNLDYAVKRAEQPVSESFREEITNILGIESLLTRYPAQLSGGEKQRVAIARAILVKPSLLLMDEPLASLDDVRKAEILTYLERLTALINIPIIYVTHSVEEIMHLADNVMVMSEGKLCAQGSVFDVFSRLDVPLGADKGVILSGKVVEIDTRWHLVKFAFAGGFLWIKNKDFSLEQPLRVQIKAADVSIAVTNHEDSSVLNRLPATITAIEQQDSNAMALVQAKVGASSVLAQLTRKSVSSLALQVGNDVWLQVKSVAIVR